MALHHAVCIPACNTCLKASQVRASSTNVHIRLPIVLTIEKIKPRKALTYLSSLMTRKPLRARITRMKRKERMWTIWVETDSRAQISSTDSVREVTMIRKSKRFHHRSGPQRKSHSPKPTNFTTISKVKMHTTMKLMYVNHRGMSYCPSWVLMSTSMPRRMRLIIMRDRMKFPSEGEEANSRARPWKERAEKHCQAFFALSFSWARACARQIASDSTL